MSVTSEPAAGNVLGIIFWLPLFPNVVLPALIVHSYRHHVGRTAAFAGAVAQAPCDTSVLCGASNVAQGLAERTQIPVSTAFAIECSILTAGMAQ